MMILEEDVIRVISQIDKNYFVGKRILVTGGTGLIGKTLVPTLLNLGVKVVLLVRSETKGRMMFGEKCRYYEGSVEKMPQITEKIDCIIHMASPTSSQFFCNNPVETISVSMEGTKALLELARKNNVDAFIYLSSMEVYGYPNKGHTVNEMEISGFDTRIARNSYPISKVLCEMLCSAYYSEYGVPTKVLRLTQTFGIGVNYDDGRIFGEIMRCVIEKRNIVLHTKGDTERCYVYTADAVSAILTVLMNGQNGEVYNVANPKTYCSIKEMAEIAAKIGHVSVEYEIDGLQRGYADTLYMNLDIGKISSIGWEPVIGLEEMFQRMINSYIENESSISV